MLWALYQGLTGSGEPATADDELDAVYAGGTEEAAQAHEAETVQADARLTIPSESPGAGMFSKLILFFMIVGVVAIILKIRKGASGTLTEKSLA